jgi:hypothetical protein
MVAKVPGIEPDDFRNNEGTRFVVHEPQRVHLHLYRDVKTHADPPRPTYATCPSQCALRSALTYVLHVRRADLHITGRRSRSGHSAAIAYNVELHPY